MSEEKPGSLEGLGLALKLLRRRAKLTLRELGARAGVGPSQLGSYERGRQRPSLETLERILVALHADLLELHVALFQARGEEVPPIKPVPVVREAPTPDDEVDALCQMTERLLDFQFVVTRLSLSRWLREQLEEARRRP
jgi:transcriptional regulator with XRE-family HTH domain